MARRIVIVSRQHPDLYVYLSDRFAAERDIEVILDRRLTERRQDRLRVNVERRRQDRRDHPDIDALLRERSHVVVTVP
jgi:hypothetical protein